ncbi:hypothetical protein VTG60DRAFT_5225 [Thermothelomyces hinnuleus]
MDVISFEEELGVKQPKEEAMGAEESPQNRDWMLTEGSISFLSTPHCPYTHHFRLPARCALESSQSILGLGMFHSQSYSQLVSARAISKKQLLRGYQLLGIRQPLISLTTPKIAQHRPDNCFWSKPPSCCDGKPARSDKHTELNQVRPYSWNL